MPLGVRLVEAHERLALGAERAACGRGQPLERLEDERRLLPLAFHLPLAGDCALDQERRRRLRCLRVEDERAEPLRKDLRAARPSAVISPVFQRLLSLSLNLGVSPDDVAGRVAEQLALSLFAEYLNMSRRTPASTRVESGILRALEHLEENYGEADCLKHLPRKSGFSRSTLGRRFRATTGLSPTRYLWRLRTEKGVAMLRETGLPAFEIATRCGFSNPFHFSRSVRRTTGASPRAIRARAWAGP